MKKILNSGLVLTLLALASISVHAQDILYITDTSGRLGTINLTTDAVTVLGSTGLALHDIGFTSNGNLYGNTTTGLYTVSTVNASTSFVGSFGSLGAGNMDGLVGYGNNLIATSFNTKGLYIVGTSPYSISTLTGTLASNTAGDATFGANGALYDVLINGQLAKITISGSSFTSTIVGPTGLTTLNGLATGATGTVYAVSGTQIYTVNLTTAAVTPFFNYAGTGLGADAGAAIKTGLAVVPEPGNVALLLTGLAGLVLYQRRRSLANRA